MYSQRQYYFSRNAKSHPILKLVNIYDRQSFIREWILDNIYVCIFMYLIFYLALWYANKVIKRIEDSNERMLQVVADNREKWADVKALKNKRQEYEDVVMEAKGTQRITARHLESEIKKLHSECASTAERLTELEKLLDKRSNWRNSQDGVFNEFEKSQYPTEKDGLADSLENVKVLEPSFPPRTPPPRKYGISVPRPTKGGDLQKGMGLK